MAFNLVTGPAAEPLHLDEAKAHLRVDDSASDALITALIRAARDQVENFTRRALVLQTFEQVYDVFLDCVMLYRSPLRSVTSITYLDTSGASQTLATTEYTVDAKSEPPRIVEAYGKSWPATRDDLNAATVLYKAGFVTPFTSNASTNTLTALNHTYSNNDVVRLSNSGGTLPAGLTGSTDYYVIGASGNTLQLSATQGGSAIDITDAGTGTHFLGEVPEPIRAAMKLMIGHLYENRESVVQSMAPIVQVPMAFESLLWPHRVAMF